MKNIVTSYIKLPIAASINKEVQIKRMLRKHLARYADANSLARNEIFVQRRDMTVSWKRFKFRRIIFFQ